MVTLEVVEPEHVAEAILSYIGTDEQIEPTTHRRECTNRYYNVMYCEKV